MRGRRPETEEGNAVPGVKLKPGETVVFLVDRVQVARPPRPRQRQGDEGPPPRGMMDPKKMPFDCKRMVYGGFKVLVDA